MNEKFNNLSLKSITKINKKNLYYVAAIGLMLIGLSNILNTPKETPIENSSFSISKYCSFEEQRLENILSHIDGVGNVHVMMTLENGIEYRYATDEKQSEDSFFTYSSGSENPSEVKQTENSQQSYILIGSTGDKKPLVLTELSPSVKGVVVVCSGASDAVIRHRVTEAVTTALGINSLQVCVIQASN